MEIMGRDAAGNVAAEKLEIKLDLDAPTVGPTIAGGRLNQDWYGGPVLVSLDARDMDSGMATLQVSLDGGPWERCEGEYVVHTSGNHRLSCRAMDVAGNEAEAKTMAINIDLQEPKVSIVGKWVGNGLLALDHQQVNLVGEDDIAVQAFFVNVDQLGWRAAREGIERLSSGVHSIEAYAVDVAGRLGPITSATVVFDPDDPIAELHLNGSLGGGGWYRGAVWLSVTATDLQPGPLITSLFVNGREVNSASFLLDGQGWHEIVYLAKDRAGNVHGPFSRHIGIDEEGPALTLNAEGRTGTNGWYTGAVTVTINASDTGSGADTVQYNLDNTGWRLCEGKLDIYYDGAHAVEVRCSDKAGNSASSSLELHLDSGGPLLPWKDGDRLHLTDRAAPLPVASGDWCSGLAMLEVSIDGAEPISLNLLSPSIELGWLSDGRHSLEIEARDGAGNVQTRVIDLSLNTDPLDPDGPNGFVPLAGIVAVILLGAILVVRRSLRNR
jgi:hypothetical protein